MTFVQDGQVMRVNTVASAKPPVGLTVLSVSVARDAVVSDDGDKVVFTVGSAFWSGAAVKRISTDAPSGVRGFLGI